LAVTATAYQVQFFQSTKSSQPHGFSKLFQIIFGQTLCRQPQVNFLAIILEKVATNCHPRHGERICDQSLEPQTNELFVLRNLVNFGFRKSNI
jgi:hypothetical protein